MFDSGKHRQRIECHFYCSFKVSDFFNFSCLFQLDLVLNDFLQFSSWQVKIILTNNHLNWTTINIQNGHYRTVPLRYSAPPTSAHPTCPKNPHPPKMIPHLPPLTSIHPRYFHTHPTYPKYSPNKPHPPKAMPDTSSPTPTHPKHFSKHSQQP